MTILFLWLFYSVLSSTEDNLDALYKTALTIELATEDALNLTTTTAAVSNIPIAFAATNNHSLTKSPCSFGPVVLHIQKPNVRHVHQSVLIVIGLRKMEATVSCYWQLGGFCNCQNGHTNTTYLSYH